MTAKQDINSQVAISRDVPEAGDRIPVMELAAALVRNWKLLLLIPTLFAMGIGLKSISGDRAYSASASFIPHVPSSGASTGASSLARQFGISLADQPWETPQVYAELLQGRTILRGAVESPYVVPGLDAPDSTVTLMEVFGLEEADGPVPAWWRAVEKLRKQLSVTVSRESGIVRLEVRGPTPTMAEQIASRLLALLNEYNLDRRQHQALDQSRFVGERMGEAGQELRSAEEHLQRFLQQNRSFANSPELMFEHDRLERQVAMRQEIYTALASAFEKSRIDAVSDVPVITTIDDPVGSARPVGRGTILRTVVAFAAAGILMSIIIIVSEIYRRSRLHNPQSFEAFDASRRQVWNDLRLAVRRFRPEQS